MNYFPHLPEDFDKATRTCDLPMVYVIVTRNFEFLKVGRSVNFKSRLSNIQSGCPLPLSLWCAIRTPTPAAVEKTLQMMLLHCGTQGEWFSPSESDLDCVMDFCATTNKNVKEVRRALLQA